MSIPSKPAWRSRASILFYRWVLSSGSDASPLASALSIAEDLAAAAEQGRNMPDFVCWASHHEDLTVQVRGVLGEKPGTVFRLMTVGRNEDGHEEARTIVVSCSEGHRNVFIVHVA